MGLNAQIWGQIPKYRDFLLYCLIEMSFVTDTNKVAHEPVYQMKACAMSFAMTHYELKITI